MKAIKLVQYGSTIGILVTVAFLLIAGSFVLFLFPDRMGALVSLGGVIALFLAPEKLAAFFGPVLKRKQDGEK